MDFEQPVLSGQTVNTVEEVCTLSFYPLEVDLESEV
jgi:hypothetical protein